MASSTAISGRIRAGGASIRFGTYTNTGSEATFELDPGADRVMFMKLQRNAGATATTGSSVDETLPYSVPRAGASKVTVDCPAGEDGYWFAIVKP
jgi:hypothetical protein